MKRRNGLIIGVIVFLVLIALVGAIVSVIVGLNTSDTAEGGASKNETAETTEEAEPEPSEQSTSSGPWKVEWDENGMAVMPETTDPREAAAAAAAIAFSADTTKVAWEDYTRAAVYQMSGFGLGVQGPSEDEAHNVLYNGEWTTSGASLEMMFVIDRWQRENPRYWNWWHLSQGTKFEDLRTMDTVWKGTPTEVFNTAEVVATGGEPVSRKPAQEWEAKTPGATLEDYWVRVDLEESMRGHVYAQTKHAALVSVWCDPPEVGGLCGVLSVEDGPIPARWAGR